MPLYYKTDDPARDWDSYCAAQADEQGPLPVCEECGDEIEDEYVFVINDAIICEDCLNKNYRKRAADLIL